MGLKKLFFNLISTTCVGFVIFSSPTVFCAEKTEQETKVQEFEKWKQHFRETAIQKGVEKSLLNKVLPELTLLENVLQADQKQSEFILTFWDYTDRTLSESRIKKGREILLEYQSFLNDVSKKYGVQSSFLVAFWGLETNYGLFKGKINTLDALATLSFDKRRRSFFTNELVTLLKLMQNGEQTEFYGSWAGAFGNFQFMPTTYAAYGVDADGDGNKDIINSLPDAFSSAANYLSQMGWDGTTSWGREVQLSSKIKWHILNKKQVRPVEEWIKIGVHPLSALKPGEEKVEAKLLMPMGVNGPKFLTYPNFDRIKRWNNSVLYALSIGLLSDRLMDEKASLYAKRRNHKISRDDIEFVQKKLAQKGFYADKPDGVLGNKTKEGIKKYQKILRLPQDGYPSAYFVQQLKKRK